MLPSLNKGFIIIITIIIITIIIIIIIIIIIMIAVGDACKDAIVFFIPPSN